MARLLYALLIFAVTQHRAGIFDQKIAINQGQLGCFLPLRSYVNEAFALGDLAYPRADSD